ncbi:hypothetical protein TSAR_009514 [Trichomalopsis sarcophagae]|uniref:Uncharacterized protein n=1 Tax=Trichomalopsis sarcophagae TaxID=543379 RepID=A0A232EWR0_9HYME|nr:hypothetical protein TSAR_009514 [Trichomalopsis sarcophagae]
MSLRDRVKLRNLTEGVINGRTIVDFNYIWKQLRDNLQDHDSKKCVLQDWQFQKEANYHGGLRTQLIFKCMSCNRNCRVWSEGLSNNQMELTEASVLSLLVEGIGYTQIHGVLAGLGLRYVTDKTFKYHQEKLLEFELAKAAGDVDENGNPFITVIVDGSWLTRSYGTKYDSLSGVGAIIGQRTVLNEEHQKKLLENQKNRTNLEELTRDQSNSDLWINLRKILLTASNFGRICRMRPRTSCNNLVKSLLFPTLNDTPAMAYGRETEDTARTKLKKSLSKHIQINGLFIDPIDPRFGASPDGLINEDGIVEIKNLFTAKDLLPEEAMKSFPHLYFIDNRTKTMKKTHHWYYQVQGQLHVIQRKYCIFALRTTKGMKIERVERNDEFWEKNMKPQLSAFYDNCL